MKKYGKSKENQTISERLYWYHVDLTKLACAEYFREPVDVQKFYCFNYYDVIKNPMDLNKMKDKMLEGAYKSIFEYKQDFELLISNCKLYNPLPDNKVRKEGIKFEDRFNSR